MDIFPPPSERVRLPPLRVPLVRNLIPYGPIPGFPSFLERNGYPGGPQSLLQIEDALELAKVLQSWLFFGVLFEWLGEVMPVSLCGIVSDKEEYVSLLPILPAVETAFHKLAHDEELRTRLADTCLLAAKASDLFFSTQLHTTSPIPEILLSVKILLAYICAPHWESLENFGETLDILCPANENQGIGSPSAGYLASQMVAVGWCPFEVETMFSKHDYATLYYIYGLREAQDSLLHQKCTATKCEANSSGSGVYRQRHRSYNCQCLDVVIPVHEVHTIINDGGIPVFAIQKSEGQFKLKVGRFQPHKKFVAISHVWSDGLGNFDQNSMPCCQIASLYDMRRTIEGHYDSSSHLGKNLWIWMDTMCIPIATDPYTNALKMKAINMMAAIYASAHAVLVVDSGVQALPHEAQGVDRLEVLARATVSKWANRSWTLQEGSLSWECLFSIGDSSVWQALNASMRSEMTLHRVSRMWQDNELCVGRIDPGPPYIVTPNNRSICANMFQEKTFIDQIALHVGRRLVYSLWSALSSTQMFGDTWLDGELVNTRSQYFQRWQVRKLIWSWNELCRRSTSMKKDVDIILASLLNFNYHPLLANEGGSHAQWRLWAILSSMRSLPISLLFNDGPRVDVATNDNQHRWIPTSIEGSPLTHVGSMHRLNGGYHFTTDSRLRTLLLELPTEQLTGASCVKHLAVSKKEQVTVEFLGPTIGTSSGRFLLIFQRSALKRTLNPEEKSCVAQHLRPFPGVCLSIAQIDTPRHTASNISLESFTSSLKDALRAEDVAQIASQPLFQKFSARDGTRRRPAVRVRATYCCAIRVWIRSTIATSHDSTAERIVTSLPDDICVLLKNDPIPGIPRLIPRSIGQRSRSMPANIHQYLLAWPSLIINLIGSVIYAALFVRIVRRREHSPPPSMILEGIFFVVIELGSSSLAIVMALLYIKRSLNRGQAKMTYDLFFLVLTFLSTLLKAGSALLSWAAGLCTTDTCAIISDFGELLPWPFLLCLFIAGFVANILLGVAFHSWSHIWTPYTYRIWLHTFDEDWKSEADTMSRYPLYAFITKWDERIGRKANRFWKWVDPWKASRSPNHWD